VSRPLCPALPADLAVRAGKVARMSRRGVGSIALAAAVTVAVGGCAGGAIGQDTPQSSGQSFVSGSGTSLLKPGSRPMAPAVSGTTLAGRHLNLATYRGSVVVVNFWASWCGPCRAEAPGLAALAARFRSRGVQFVGVDVRDDPTSADAFLRTYRITYPSLNDPGEQIALDFSQSLPIAATPTTLVIDRSGRIAGRIFGSVSYNGLKTLIMQVAAEHSVTAAGATR
jgi:thiol-disulfide isomerase/thioredoxin